MTADKFVIQFPEFKRVQLDLIQAHLDAAAARLEDTSGLWDQAHGYLTAHLLALSPTGQAAKLVAKDGSTTYQRHLNDLLAILTAGNRVI